VADAADHHLAAHDLALDDDLRRGGTGRGGERRVGATQHRDRDRGGDGGHRNEGGDAPRRDRGGLARADRAADGALEWPEADQQDLEGERPEDPADQEDVAALRGNVGGPPEQEDAGREAAGGDLGEEIRHDLTWCSASCTQA
jgi:hypothetical protein